MITRYLPLGPQIIHLHQLLLIIIPMLHLKRLRVINHTRIARPVLASLPKPACKPTPPRIRVTPVVSVFRVVRRVERCAEDLGEEAHEEDAHGGHARAHDAYVELDRGPVDDVELVPGGVVRGGEGDEGLEAEDGDDGYAMGGLISVWCWRVKGAVLTRCRRRTSLLRRPSSSMPV